MFWEVHTSSLEFQMARNQFQSGKNHGEEESGKPDKLNIKQERRKNEPRAAEKRPKSTERHFGDA